MNAEEIGQKAYAARLLAVGYPVSYITKEVGIKSRTTFYKWMLEPSFIAMRDQFIDRIDQAIEADMLGSIAEMIAVWRQWLRSEIPGNDPRIPIIAPTILSWVSRLVDSPHESFAKTPTPPLSTTTLIERARDAAASP